MAQHSQDTRDHTSSPDSAPPVVVHGDDITVSRTHSELPLGEARSRFGGIDVPAVLAGGLAGLGTAALLGGLATALGISTSSVDQEALVVGGLIAALVLVALSALVAGWVAGRAARFDGARNGLLAGLLFALLLALMGAAGAYSAADNGIPVSLDGDRLTAAALAAALGALLVAGLVGALAGRLGTRWHRDVDDVLVGTRAGAAAPAPIAAGISTATPPMTTSTIAPTGTGRSNG